MNIAMKAGCKQTAVKLTASKIVSLVMVRVFTKYMNGSFVGEFVK